MRNVTESFDPGSTFHGNSAFRTSVSESFRVPQSALPLYRHSPTQRSYGTGVTPPALSTSMPDGSRYALR